MSRARVGRRGLGGREERDDGLRAVATSLWPDARMCLQRAAPRPEEQPVTINLAVGYLSKPNMTILRPDCLK
jgi:hypothetical protein